ncbi:MAG: hypothetical protein K9N06_01955 [Candidatus Cloacimonetes bacterium]|nr:hypothetical protein [Candidatus Cloacimonadota bacterium]
MLVDVIKSFRLNTFKVLSGSEFDLITIQSKSNNVVVKYSNPSTGSFVENEISNREVYSDPIFQSEDNYWFCLRDSQYRCWLTSAFDENHRPKITSHLIYTLPFGEELLQPYSIFEDSIAVKYIVDDNIEQRFKFLTMDDTLTIIFKSEFLQGLINTSIDQVDNSLKFSLIADSLAQFSGTNFENKSIWKILTNKLRANWYQDTLKGNRGKSFFIGKILGACDMENDGDEDFLIYITGNRFTASYLVCYNPAERRELWKTQLYNTITKCIIKDIDNDGFVEIILALYAPGSGMGADWFDMETKFLNHRSYIAVFDNQGKLESYNGKPAMLDTGGYTTNPRFACLSESKIIIAPTSDHNLKERKPFIVDFVNDQLDTLSIDYHSVLSLQNRDNIIEFFHQNEDTLYATKIRLDGKIRSNYTRIIKQASSLPKDFNFSINGKEFITLNPSRILDDKLNLIYSSNELLGWNMLQQKGNMLYFATSISQSKELLLSTANLTENKDINPQYIMIWIFIILLFIVHLITRTIFSIPEEIAKSNYAVLYRFLGIIYTWRIFSKTSIYTQPVLGSFSRKKFFYIITDLCENYQEQSVRNLGFVKLYVYRLAIDNEMHIVQRIAHDIKNQVHLVNMKLTENSYERNDIEDSMRVIFEKTAMLSDFSRINLMQKSKIDMVSLLDTILIKFSAHNRYKDMIWEPEKSSIFIEADENLLHVALLNVLENSLRYSPENTDVLIMIVEEYNKVSIQVTNQIIKENLQKGSGIGLLATERIIKAHGGEFQFELQDSAQVKIILLKENRGSKNG